MENLSSVWDWPFFWNVFLLILGVAASFVLIIVAIHSVGLLIEVVIRAIRK